ncbi:MAG: sigma-70 family RNA polymerase sigma factor [Rhodothermaceae bacterium]|nr:sigma-70 family RNA polymerase sigma factor [Rhodothermaceae bacterium]
MVSQETTTQLLRGARKGNSDASERLFAHLYEDLKRLAHARLTSHRSDATLGTTGLVHESYLRMIDTGQVEPQDRVHFFALAARTMRFVLLDRARARTRKKRGGRRKDLGLDQVAVAADMRADDLLALDEALEILRASNERLAAVVDYRFFGGLTYEEIAEVMATSKRTAERDWGRARMWLYRFMSEPKSSGHEGP